MVACSGVHVLGGNGVPQWALVDVNAEAPHAVLGILQWVTAVLMT